MSELVQRIEKCIKEKGSNFKRVERECGLGNGTIKRWSEQSPRLDKLVVVAEYLQVSLDYLVFGGSVSETSVHADEAPCRGMGAREGLICDGSPLNELEADLVAMFRLLPPSHQEELFNLAYFKYKNYVEREKESIFSTYFDESSNAKSDPADSHERRSGTA